MSLSHRAVGHPEVAAQPARSREVQKLLSFLYPNYADIGNALTISQSPLVRLKVMNLISNNRITSTTGMRGSTSRETPGTLDKLNLGLANDSSGLLGAIKNVSINHNLDNPDYGVFHVAKGSVIPKAIEISLDFAVIHEGNLGWDHDEFGEALFPYGADLEGSLRASGRGNNEALLAAQNKEAEAYTEDIRRQRQEEADERSLQAAKDIAKAKLLKADGTLNRKGKRLKRRIENNKVRNSKKAAVYAGALKSTEKGATGADVRQASIDASTAADNRWDFIE